MSRDHLFLITVVSTIPIWLAKARKLEIEESVRRAAQFRWWTSAPKAGPNKHGL